MNVKVEFTNQGDIISYKSDRNEQYPKTENESLGANAWETVSETNQHKPLSNQDRFKGLFGEYAE